MKSTRRGFVAALVGGVAVALGLRPAKAKCAPITGRCSACGGPTVTGQARKLNCGWRSDLCNGCNEANDPRYLYLKRGLPEMTWRKMHVGDVRNELTDKENIDMFYEHTKDAPKGSFTVAEERREEATQRLSEMLKDPEYERQLVEWLRRDFKEKK